ncbi:hypothetical protein NFI96_025534, partial [Prochilodus magdalenae]
MDPVQKAVISHTFGLPQPIKKKQIISCNICHLRFNSTVNSVFPAWCRSTIRFLVSSDSSFVFTIVEFGVMRFHAVEQLSGCVFPFSHALKDRRSAVIKNQAEAHYKGHKHTRKLKAIDNLKNKQRGQGRERDREKKKEREREDGKTGHPPGLMDSSVTERTAIISDLQAARQKLDEPHAQGSSVMLTPISDSSSTNPAPPQSPQVSPNSQQSGISDEAVPDAPALGSNSEPSDTKPEEEKVPDAGAEPNREGRKNSKQNLHCPVCKVTVNSSSQLEAHFSGSKHKLMLEGQCVQPRRRGGKVVSSRMNPRPKRHGNKNSATSSSQSYHCDVCDITVNSETQLKQ